MCFFYVPYQHHKCQIVAGIYIQLGIIVLFFVFFFICPSTADIEHGLENWSGYLSPTAAQSIKTTDI